MSQLDQTLATRQSPSSESCATSAGNKGALVPTLTSPDQQQAVLMQTAKSLLAATTMEDLWTAVLVAANRTLAAERAAICLYGDDGATCPAAEGLSPGYITAMCANFDTAAGQQIWADLEPIVINDIHNDGRAANLHAATASEGFHAYIIFPLLTAEATLLGALITYRDQPVPFTTDDVTAGQTLAHMAALALHNIQLLNETRLNLIREQQLNEITRALGSTMDLPTILGHVLRMTADLTGADAGLLGLVIDHQIMTFYPHNIPENIVLRPAPRGRGIAWEVAQSGETLHLDHYPDYHLAQPKWIAVGVKALTAVPLTAADTCLGALILFNLDNNRRQFTERQVALAEAIGRQAAIAIQHARMYAEANQRTTALRHALARQAELDDLKNKFIQTVSHELRTPLGIIHGHAELMGMGAMGELSPRLQESVDIISRRVRMLIDLMDDLTAMLAAETQELRREEVQLDVLLYAMLDEYRLQANKTNITLQTEIAETIPPIMGDITHLRRVVDNLVSNAFKFTPPEGTVTLRLWSEDEQVILEVADTGMGIPEEQLGRIFERFYQVVNHSKRQHGGTGLGLALVKEIVQSHRGEVS
ncbi:MAG TPA: GAF domain-containing protein, partial [Chloroflexota bacterium]|nr:GAF domain-containing protein [Chloroflexota bacterium]